MNTILKITLIGFISLLLGCSNEFKFDRYYIEHFPKNMATKMEYYEYSMKLPEEFKQYGASRKEVFEYKGAIKTYVDTLIINAKNNVYSTDSCIIILPIRYSKNIDIGKPLINDCNKDSSSVLPNLVEMRDYLSLDDSKFTFYILDNKAGVFLGKEDLFNDEIMPKPWTNGYTKGVAINYDAELVLFWVDIW